MSDVHEPYLTDREQYLLGLSWGRIDGAELRELLATVSQLRQAQRWIPASECKPERNCVVRVEGGIARWNGERWISETSGAWGCPIEWEVTHWKYMDDPPALASASEGAGGEGRQ